MFKRLFIHPTHFHYYFKKNTRLSFWAGIVHICKKSLTWVTIFLNFVVNVACQKADKERTDKTADDNADKRERVNDSDTSACLNKQACNHQQ